MSLREYLIDKNVGMILEKYSRDNDISPSMVIEHLLETFLYEKGYINDDVEDDMITPAELYEVRKSKFLKLKHNGLYHLTYGDLDFGHFKVEEIEEVMDRLLDFSDDELRELDKNKWKYSSRKYGEFIREKLENPLLTPDKFMNAFRISKWDGTDKVRFVFYKGKFRKQIVQFNRNIYSNDVINKAYSFVLELSEDEIWDLFAKKEKSKTKSADFFLKYMNEYGVERLPYSVVNKSGNILFQRKGFTFGTHKVNKAREVWEFLNSKGWDKSFSTKGKGLTGKNYLNWLYSEIENEKVLNINDGIKI